MSSNLDFYSISWADVSTVIGTRNRRLLKPVLEKVAPDFDELFEADDFEGGPNLEAGLERWIEGAVSRGQDNPPFRVDQLGDALAFVSLAKYFGQFVGSLNHSVSSGVAFRQQFLSKVAQDILEPPFPMAYLISRPVVGYLSSNSPWWGGLSSSELALVGPKLKADAPVWPDDLAIDEWLKDLWTRLGCAADMGKDLICVYS